MASGLPSDAHEASGVGTPSEAKVSGRPRSAKRHFWDEHPGIVLGTSVAVLIQSILISALLVHHRRRRRMEKELRLSEERYREVVESQTEMVCRYRADSTLTFVNEAYCRYFGKSREELLGTRFLMLIPDAMHGVVMGMMDNIIETRTPAAHEHQVLRVDGSIGWMHWDDYPIFNDRGVLVELQGIGRDISERRLAEEALRQSEERFAGVFRGSPAAIAIIRQAGGYLVDVNPSWERFFEIDRAEALGKSPIELGLIGSAESDRRFRSFLEAGESLNGFEQMVRTRGGDIRWMSLSSELITLAGEPCFVVMSKDITEAREVEESRQGLIQATRLAMLGELTASIAHEVNQPLGAILSNADAAEILLERSDPPIAELRNILADIRRDDIRASEVIKRVRDLIGKREMRMEPLYLNEILTETIRLVAHDAQRRGVVIIPEFAMNLPVISCDHVQIEQVILNLLLNAMDAIKNTPLSERRLVLRSARHAEGWVEATVEDRGHGIPHDKIDRIFESFFSTKEQGMGLGLALGRSIAEAHGGRLKAENNPAGGAIFRLILPTIDGSASHEKP